MICALHRTRDGWEELRRMAESREAGWSALGHSFLQYDREVFIEALSDWGWCGDGAHQLGIGTQIPKTSSSRKASSRLGSSAVAVRSSTAANARLLA